MVRVAPWVVEEEKRSLQYCLIGSLRSTNDGIREVELWLERVWGKMIINSKMMDPHTVLIQLSSNQDIDEILAVQEIHRHLS